MPKVFGTHLIGLRPGVSGDGFEWFFRDKFALFPAPPGWKTYLLKGDRGDRKGDSCR